MRITRILICAVIFLLLFNASLVAAELLIFGADWCPSCHKLTAALSAQPTLAGNYTVTIFDVEKVPDLAKMYGITSVPALLVLKNNGAIKRKVGFTTPDNLKTWLRHVGE